MPEPLTIQKIMRSTTEARLPRMMRNLALNMSKILEGKNVYDLPKNKKKPCLVVGAGPSIQREKHLNLLAKSKWKHSIIACDRMLIPLLKKGILPDYAGSVDGHPIISKFYNHKLVDKYAKQIKAAMPVTIHPLTLNRFKGDVYWFVPRMDDFAVEGWISLTKALSYQCMKTVLVTGANCGTFCWNLAFYLRYNPIILIGFDLSYDTKDYTKTTYYSALNKHFNNPEDVKKAIEQGHNPVFNRDFLIDPVFKTYLAFMLAYINKVNVRTINCTEGGSLFGGRVVCAGFKEILKRYKL